MGYYLVKWWRNDKKVFILRCLTYAPSAHSALALQFGKACWVDTSKAPLMWTEENIDPSNDSAASKVRTSLICILHVMTGNAVVEASDPPV
jgi:hypothetical protein